jgi:hypothetical protein
MKRRHYGRDRRAHIRIHIRCPAGKPCLVPGYKPSGQTHRLYDTEEEQKRKSHAQRHDDHCLAK